MFKRGHEANVVASFAPAEIKGNRARRHTTPFSTLENRYANLRANPSNLGPCTALAQLPPVVSRVFHHHPSPHATLHFPSKERGLSLSLSSSPSFRRYSANPPPLRGMRTRERRAKGYKAGLAKGLKDRVPSVNAAPTHNDTVLSR